MAPTTASTPGAVFLSYASQDAEAARRIADALRAAGVEVWFDQSELVGGDAWDQKIRRQIKECALLIPIISENTQVRTEGYFRLEWRLADQRTHLMAKGRPFLLPVVIDGTRDAEAHVPDSFTEVQWTKAPGGEVPPAFAARVQKILNGEPAAQTPRPAAPVAGGSPARGARRPWLIPAFAGVLAAIALAVWQPWKKAQPDSGAAKLPAPAAAPTSEARKLANQAMQLLEEPNSTRESSWLADELCERALKLDAGDAEIWATAALASVNLYWNTYDRSVTRREKISSQATRASRLDPGSVRAALAVARSQDLDYENKDSLRMLRELHGRAPQDQQVIFHLVRAEGARGNEAAVQELLRKLRALPRTGVLPLTQGFVALRLRSEARFAEADVILDEMLSGPEPQRGAYYEKLQVLMYSWHELAEVEPHLERIPLRYCQEPAFGSAIAQYWLWRKQPEKALQALARVPQDYLEEYAASEPKALLTGWAHALAGRAAAAQAEWRQALALVDERLKTDSRNFTRLNQRALLLALTGQSGAAREAWQLRVELGGDEERPSFLAAALLSLALNEPERAIAAITAAWPKLRPRVQIRALPIFRHHPAMAAISGDARMQQIFAEGAAMLQRLKAEQTGVGKTAGSELSDTSAPALIKADDKSVAVLAFANLSDDKANEYFSDGISEELLNVLAKVPGLKVTARTSSFHFKGKDTPIPEIAKQLGVAYVVEGSVRKAGDKVRITAQLIKAADGFHVWSDTFTRDLKDVFAVQDEIAGLIAQNLKLKLETGDPAHDKSTDLAAWQSYLDGRRAWNLRTMEGYREAETLLQRAIALDARFPRAYAALADVWHIRAIDQNAGVFSRQWRTSPTALKARALIDKALELDPRCAEAYASLGMNLQLGWQDEAALDAYRRAIELNPNYATAHQWLGLALLGVGRMDETLSEVKQAAELDPLSHRILSDYAKALNLSGNPAEALIMSRRALALQPGAVQAVLQTARALTMLGQPREAVALVEGMNRQDIPERLLPDTFAILSIAKQPEAIRRLIGDVDAMPPSMAKFASLVALGRIDDAFAKVDSSILEDGWSVVEAAYGQLFEPIRHDARFQRIIESSGRAEYFRLAQAWREAHPPLKPEVKP